MVLVEAKNMVPVAVGFLQYSHRSPADSGIGVHWNHSDLPTTSSLRHFNPKIQASLNFKKRSSRMRFHSFVVSNCTNRGPIWVFFLSPRHIWIIYQWLARSPPLEVHLLTRHSKKKNPSQSSGATFTASISSTKKECRYVNSLNLYCITVMLNLVLFA